MSSIPRPVVESRPAGEAATADGPLTLERAIDVALLNNPDVGADAWDLEAARAEKRRTMAEHLPTLGFNAAYRHNWYEERLGPVRTPGEAAVLSRDVFAFDLGLSVPILSGGRMLSDVAASELLRKAAEHRLAQTRSEVVFNVKSTFFSILGQEKLLEAIGHSRQALEEHRRVAEALVAQKKAAPVEVMSIEVRLADLEQRWTEQLGQLEITRRLLVSVMGLSALPSDGLVVEGDLPFVRVKLDREELVATALESRDDLRELGFEVKAQAKRVDAARAEYWPVVSAEATYGARVSAQGDYADLGYASVGVSYPLLGGFATRAKVAGEQAKLNALLERRRQLALRVQQEVDSAVIRVRTAGARVESTEKAIGVAAEVLRIEGEKARLGRGTTLEVLTAQDALLGAETSHFTALVALHLSLALLDLATGTR